MSFKDKIIQHCENTKYNCEDCVFKTPCDEVSKYGVTKFFTDEQMERLEKGIYAEHRRLCMSLALMLDFLFDLKKEEKHEQNNL